MNINIQFSYRVGCATEEALGDALTAVLADLGSEHAQVTSSCVFHVFCAFLAILVSTFKYILSWSKILELWKGGLATSMDSEQSRRATATATASVKGTKISNTKAAFDLVDQREFLQLYGRSLLQKYAFFFFANLIYFSIYKRESIFWNSFSLSSLLYDISFHNYWISILYWMDIWGNIMYNRFIRCLSNINMLIQYFSKNYFSHNKLLSNLQK